MNEETPNLIRSGLSGVVSQDGVTVDVQVYRLDREPVEWSLEVVNDAGTSIIWDDMFPTDKLAYEEFRRMVAGEGIRAFIENTKVILFRR